MSDFTVDVSEVSVLGVAEKSRVQAQRDSAPMSAQTASSSEWRRLHDKFKKLAENDFNWVDPALMALSRPVPDGVSLEIWDISQGTSEQIKADFELRATEAGIALGAVPDGVKPLDYWLHALRHDLSDNRSELLSRLNVSRPIDGTGQKEKPVWRIKSVCEASAIFCTRLERAALEAAPAKQQATEPQAHSARVIRKKKTTPKSTLNTDVEMWNDLYDGFMDLANEEKPLLGGCELKAWADGKDKGPIRHWLFFQGQSQNREARFEALASRAANQLGGRPDGVRLLDFWLESLCKDHFSRKESGAKVHQWQYASKHGDTCLIPKLCEESADFCKRLEASAFNLAPKKEQVAKPRRVLLAVADRLGREKKLEERLRREVNPLNVFLDRRSGEDEELRDAILEVALPAMEKAEEREVQTRKPPKDFNPSIDSGLRMAKYPSQLLTNLRLHKPESRKDVLNRVREKRRGVTRPSMIFDEEIGARMHKARQALRDSGHKTKRQGGSPTLPASVFKRIVSAADCMRKGERLYPLKNVLPSKKWAQVALHNQKLGVSKPLNTFEQLLAHPNFKNAARKRFNRAEIYYREKLAAPLARVQQASRTEI